MTNMAKKKKRNRGRRPIAVTARTLILFDLIRSEIAMLPRPGNSRSDGDSKKIVRENSTAIASSGKEVLPSEQAALSQCETCYALMGKLEAYESAITKIDDMSRRALGHLEAVNLGGKPSYQWARTRAISIANGYYRTHRKFPTMRVLRKEFCYQLFQENPLLYIDKAGAGLSEADLAELSRTPHWIQWSEREKKPVSGRWISELLTELKTRLQRTGILYEVPS